MYMSFSYIFFFLLFFFFFYSHGDNRYLHKLTHSFPTRRSSDLGIVIAGDPDPVAAALQEAQHRAVGVGDSRSEEHTSELQSRELISYAVFCLKKKKKKQYTTENVLFYKKKKKK